MKALKRIGGQGGQAMAEFMAIVPLLALLAGGCMVVVYVCWQGIKVQQAANLAARIHGQERVAGGLSRPLILQDNGLAGNPGDDDPTNPITSNGKITNQSASRFKKSAPAGGVFKTYYDEVRSWFTPGEANNLFIPAPTYGPVGNTDKVSAVRLITFPKFFDFQPDPVTLKAEAYGGEDPKMYGLPRWGRESANSASPTPFWRRQFRSQQND